MVISINQNATNPEQPPTGQDLNIVKPVFSQTITGYQSERNGNLITLMLKGRGVSAEYENFGRIESPRNPQHFLQLGQRDGLLSVLTWNGSKQDGHFVASPDRYSEIYYDRNLQHFIGKKDSTMFLIEDDGSYPHEEGFQSITLDGRTYYGFNESGKRMTVKTIPEEFDRSEYW
jgi:hypothetical protein